MTRLHPFNPTEVAESGGSVSNGKQSAYVSEISAYVGNQKKRAQRRNAAPETLGPTSERLAKVDAVEEILVPVKDRDTRASSKVTRLLSVFEAHRARMPEEHAAALQAALDDVDKAIVQNGNLISSYGDGGGGAYGPRHGGVPDHVREAFNRIVAMRAYLGEEIFSEFLAYVVEVANEARRRAGLSPWSYEATKKGVHWGWDAAKLDSLAKAIRHWQARERALGGRVVSTHQEVTARRQEKREKAAKEGRR